MKPPSRAPGYIYFFGGKTIVTILALLSLFQSIGGFYRLEALNAARIDALSGPHWMVAYGPPAWLMLVLASLLAALALVLVWRLPKTQTIRLLALFSVLLASGYAVLMTASASPLLESYIGTIPTLLRWGMPDLLLRTLGSAVAMLERLMWIGAWAFAAAVAVFFVRRVLKLQELKTLEFSSVFAMVQLTWASVATFWPTLASVKISSYVLVVLGCAVLLGTRGRDARSARAILALTTVLLLLQVWTLDAMRSLEVAWHVFNLLPMTVIAIRLERTAAWCLLLPPIVLAVAAANSSDTIAVGLPATYLWVATCMAVILSIIARRYKYLAPKEQRQALWFMSGLLAATVSAAIWFAITNLGRIAGCTQEYTNGLCLLYAYKEWWLILPLPVLLLSFITALMYSGPIDSASFFRRTFLYGSALLTALFVLGAADAFLSGFISRGLPGGTPPLVAAGLMAVLLNPLKRIGNHGVDILLARLESAETRTN